MVTEQLQILVSMYFRPAQALSAMLDRGSLVFAAVAAIAVSLPLSAAFQLLGVAVLFVPASIAIVAAWDGLGSASVALRRDYSPMLACTLLAWTAAHLPVAIAALGARSMLGDESLATAVLALRAVGAVYFLILAMAAVRAVTGTNLAHALGTVLGGVTAIAVGTVVYGAVGGFLASPFVLFWLYILFRPNLDFLSGGLRARQNFRRHLEASTLNPRDADAHYQLGLIYLQRRNYAEAIVRFQKAVEIDQSEPDPHFQLGKIAREQGRHEDALKHFQACAAQDPKHNSSEVQRELGAANFQLGHTELALSQLQDYVDRREYDAEGQYWFGMVLKQVGRADDAREAFQKSVDAASTAPPHVRRQASRWLKLSRTELK